jgi:hypothetical protein
VPWKRYVCRQDWKDTFCFTTFLFKLFKTGFGLSFSRYPKCILNVSYIGAPFVFSCLILLFFVSLSTRERGEVRALEVCRSVSFVCQNQRDVHYFSVWYISECRDFPTWSPNVTSVFYLHFLRQSSTCWRKEYYIMTLENHVCTKVSPQVTMIVNYGRSFLYK